MKHVYVPRMTSYGLNPDDELNDLRMSDQVRPLYDHVRQFIRETVEPMSVEFYRHGENKTDRWSFTPAQLEVLRASFDRTVADPAFLADAEKLGIDIEPLSGAKVQDVVAKLYATPPAIVERARKAIRPD